MRRDWLLRIAASAGAAGAVLVLRSKSKTPARELPDPVEELARELTRCSLMTDVLFAIERSFRSAAGFPSAIFIPEDDRITVKHHSRYFHPGDNDLANARLAISNGRPVSQLTSAPDLYSYFLPLTTWRGTLGAFAFRAGNRQQIPRRTWALAEAFASQTSLAIMRSTFEAEARRAEILGQADTLHKALLNSIAHNVRTPLASIIGVLSTLQEDEISLSEPIRRDLIDTARQEAERLNRLLGNLLDLSRLEAGVLQIRNDPCDVQDLIGAALEQLGSATGNRRIDVRIPPDLPFVPMDFVLIVQVLVNLLDNALKYSPAGPSITVEARVLSNALELSVSDFGDGIANDDLPHIFERFNRGGRTGETGGIGLGLSICKALIEAHHGTIRAERRHPRGTAVTFTVPLRQEK